VVIAYVVDELLGFDKVLPQSVNVGTEQRAVGN
jgi:hypothetical protein